MIIDQQKCVGCGRCKPYCPVQAIYEVETGEAGTSPTVYRIDRERCVECGTCWRAAKKYCPNNAIIREELQEPRVVRRAFSDPCATHEETGIPGRGTAEMKTNDVTGRYKAGEVGMGIELGRPGVSTKIKEAEKFTKKLAALDVKFEAKNPLTLLMENQGKGTIENQYLEERVLSLIIEFSFDQEIFPKVLETIKEPLDDLNTVVSLDVITKFKENKENYRRIKKIAEEHGFPLKLEEKSSKHNLGFGKMMRDHT